VAWLGEEETNDARSCLAKATSLLGVAILGAVLLVGIAIGFWLRPWG
jgi:hypothetical protein